MTEPPRDFGHSPWAQQRRLWKAIAIETQLAAEGIPAAAVESLPGKSRRRIERAAGVRVSSDETWRLAAELLADDETNRDRRHAGEPGETVGGQGDTPTNSGCETQQEETCR